MRVRTGVRRASRLAVREALASIGAERGRPGEPSKRLDELPRPALWVAALAGEAEADASCRISKDERAAEAVPQRKDRPEVAVVGLGSVVQPMETRRDEERFEEFEP